MSFISSKQSANWILVKSAYVRLCFFCNKIEEGYLEFNSVIASGLLKRLSPVEQEPWEIYKGYFVWFQNIGKLTFDKNSGHTVPFRLGKFMNMVPLQSKDKEGYNATVLVLQLLFLIQMKDYDALIDKTEALRAYAYRYLRKRQMYRTRWFVKMLLLIPLNYFNKTAILRKAPPLYEKMSSKPVSEASISSNMEIVPYELLWEKILGLLDTGFSKSSKRKA